MRSNNVTAKRIAFILFITLLLCIASVFAVNKVRIKQFVIQKKIIVKKCNWNERKIKTLLLKKYIIEHSLIYTNDDTNVDRIIDAINTVVNENYEKLTMLKAIYSKNMLKNLITAIIQTESSFDIYSKSHNGAIGLMQIKPVKRNLEYLNKCGIKITNIRQLYDPVINITSGLFLLNHHFEIAKRKLNGTKHNVSNLITKALNIYSGDRTGRYSVRVLKTMSLLTMFLTI